MFVDLMEGAQAEAVEGLTRALVEATTEAMHVHGDDPKAPVLISAAFAYALHLIGQDDVSIPITVRGMLERMAARPPGSEG